MLSSLRKMVQSKPVVIIDIVSDIACPWCFVGKRRLEQAIQILEPKATFQVNWHPYQLDPNAPLEGVPRDEFLRKRFGPVNPRMAKYMDHLNDTGMQCGIDFCFSDPAKTANKLVSNTFDAHRLVYLAQSKYPSTTDKLVTLLFQTYQEKGLNLSNREVLLDVAQEAGLPRDEVSRFLDSQEAVQEIRNEDETAKQGRITGVPHFSIRGPTIELTAELLKTWSVRQLKSKLHRRGVDDTECVEKSDLIQKIIETKTKEKPKIEVLSGAQEAPVFVEAIEAVLQP